MSNPRKYRGLRVDNKEWVKGWLFKYKYCDKTYIVLNEYSADELQHEPRFFSKFAWHEVIPETVGQDTGLKDKKRTEEFPDGQPIYQGDIVKILVNQWDSEKPEYRLHEVTSRCPFCAIPCPYLSIDNVPQWEVIGDIHTTPELMEDKQ